MSNLRSMKRHLDRKKEKEMSQGQSPEVFSKVTVFTKDGQTHEYTDVVHAMNGSDAHMVLIIQERDKPKRRWVWPLAPCTEIVRFELEPSLIDHPVIVE
jgi:hypothetical protein